MAQDPMSAARAKADDIIRRFHGIGAAALPTKKELHDAIPSTALNAIESGVDAGGDFIRGGATPAANGYERWAGRLGKGAIRGPALAYEATQVWANRNNPRKLAGVAGNVVGSVLGGAVGELGGPVLGVVGASAGGTYGERAGTYLYDHRQDIADGVSDALTRGWGPSADPRVRSTLMGPRYR